MEETSLTHTYYSQRKGTNPNLSGLSLSDTVDLFCRIYDQMRRDGYFTEAFGLQCVDTGDIEGKVPDIELEMLLTIRKKDLWPLAVASERYSEDDFFDVLEFLYQHVSKPIDGTYHSWLDCGMHWETFNQEQGRVEYRSRVNSILSHYEKAFEISAAGEVLHRPEAGFETIFEADIPSRDSNIVTRIEAAVLRFRRHGSTIDDRRQAVRDLADVLEYLRPKVKRLLIPADESDLFNIANNFGIRHHNEKQRIAYDANLWLSWMFYVFLATIHVVLRKIDHDGK